ASNQQGAHAPRSPESKSRRLGQVPAEAPADVDEMNDQHDDHPRNKKKRGPVSAYFAQSGARTWLKKMSGAVF
ncbi:MAG: hypothetical protein NXI22_18675, partial [bacterium]|nr:hypothetical protein [bacterium]